MRIVQPEDMLTRRAVIGDYMLVFDRGMVPGDKVDFSNGYHALVEEVAGELYYRFTMDPRTEKLMLYPMRYAASPETVAKLLAPTPRPPTRWQWFMKRLKSVVRGWTVQSR